MTELLLKYGACAGLLALWIVLDYLKLNDADLIWTIKIMLGTLGGWHAIAKLQTVPPEAPPAPAPRAPSYPTVPLE